VLPPEKPFSTSELLPIDCFRPLKPSPLSGLARLLLFGAREDARKRQEGLCTTYDQPEQGKAEQAEVGAASYRPIPDGPEM
jgi:hypothetical protein